MNDRKKLYLGLAVLLVVVLLACIFGCDSTNVQDGLALAAGPAFAPLKWPMGRNNMGGYKGRLLYVPTDAVTKVPSVPTWDEAEGNEELVTAVGEFTFYKDGAYQRPIYLYSTDATVGYTAEAQGETDGISYRQTLTAFFPGNMKEAHAFAALVKNTTGYYVFEDSDGQQMIIGQEGMPASTSVSFNGGQARADRRGHTFTITADSNYSTIFLEKPIDMEAVASGTATFPTSDGGTTTPGGDGNQGGGGNQGGSDSGDEGFEEDPLA